MTKRSQNNALSGSFRQQHRIVRAANKHRCLGHWVKPLPVFIFPSYPWTYGRGDIICRYLLRELLLPPGEQTDEVETVITWRFVEAVDVTAYRLEALPLVCQKVTQFFFPESSRQR